MSSTYTTVQGDMWDSIAYKAYGNVKYTDALMRANPKYHDVYIFESGVQITIPDLDDTPRSDDLPPWRRPQK